MKDYIIAEDMLQNYRAYLLEEEKSALTVEKYMRDLKKFQVFLSEKEVKKDLQ